MKSRWQLGILSIAIVVALIWAASGIQRYEKQQETGAEYLRQYSLCTERFDANLCKEELGEMPNLALITGAEIEECDNLVSEKGGAICTNVTAELARNFPQHELVYWKGTIFLSRVGNFGFSPSYLFFYGEGHQWVYYRSGEPCIKEGAWEAEFCKSDGVVFDLLVEKYGPPPLPEMPAMMMSTLFAYELFETDN